MHRLNVLLILIIMSGIFSADSLPAATINMPEWYRLSAVFDGSPRVNEKIGVIATLSALVGEIRNIKIELKVPKGWTPATPTAQLDRLASGTSRAFFFQLQAGGPVPNGSIGVSFTGQVPKNGIGAAIRAPSREEAEAMLEVVKKLPDQGGGYADIAFSLFAEEGFFPLGSDMWLFYDDRMTPPGMIRGPVLYRDSVLTLFQAQTDVEMYEKLLKLLASDEKAAAMIRNSAVNLDRKKQDYLTALYVLATEAFIKRDLDACLSNITKLEEAGKDLRESYFLDLGIASGNLKALCYWAKGEKKQAENNFRDIFYKNRKHPAQRYVLRNLGLLQLEKNDKANGREMLRLALELKSAYTLLEKEYSLVKKP